MLKSVLLVLVSLSVYAADELYIVDSPDIAVAGEYWEPAGSGWGLTMNLQPANFSPTGYYLQGEVYTYNDDGTPVWYVFQGDYTPNEDVYAWREGRGPLATFESPMGISQGGGCIDCTHSPNQISLVDKGNIKLEWSDPITVTMTVNGVSKHLKNMFFHDGLGSNSADFITERMFFVHGAYSMNLNMDLFSFVKGTSVFYPITQDIVNFINTWDLNRFEFDNDLTWYVTKENVLSEVYATEETLNNNPYLINIFREVSVNDIQNTVFLLLGFDELSGLAYIYPGMSLRDTGGSIGYSLFTCANQSQSPVSYVGLLNPAASQSSRFYYNDNDYMSKCSNDGANNDWKRQHFIDLTGLPVGFDDLHQVPFMTVKPSY